jgi:GTP-binding protein
MAKWDGRSFEVMDTGGIMPGEREHIPEQVLRQAEVAIREADLILLVVDVRAGLNPLDQSLCSMLRARGSEPLLVVNKVETLRMETEALQFHALGLRHLFPVSAEHNLQLTSLIGEILSRFPEAASGAPEAEEIRVAIVGRPNVGKSSLLNRFVGEERSIVTSIPGTTRDAVDTLLRVGDQAYRLVDTAGIRKKSKTVEIAEKLSVIMARKNLERADVALLVLDASEPPSTLDAVIGRYAQDAGASILITVNKSDLMPSDSDTRTAMTAAYRDRMRALGFAPLVFVSAKTGRGVSRIFDQVDRAYEGRMIRVVTSELNVYLERHVATALAPEGSGRKSRLKYACQVATAPPTFVFFTRGSKKLDLPTRRYLARRLREKYDFHATPIRILQRSGRRREELS